MPTGLARITESPGHHMGMHLHRGCQADESLCKHGKFFRVYYFYQKGFSSEVSQTTTTDCN